MNNETMLSSLVRGVRDNKINKEEFYKKMYEDVYALVYPVMKNKKDSKDYTEDAIDYIYNNLSQINLDKNIYRQIASLVSSFLVKDLLEDAGEYELKDCAYTYDNLKEDKELLNICKNNVTAFRNVKDFKGCGKKFRTLPSVLMAMLELFGYEMRSIGEIAKLTNLSEDKVRGLLNEIRRHYGYEILAGYVSKEDSQELNDLEGFEFIDDNTNVDLEPIVKEDLKESKEASEISEAKKVSELSVAKKDSETKKAKEADFEEDEEDEEDEGKKAGPVVGFFARLFPDLSITQARIVTASLCGLVVAMLAVFVLVPVLNNGEVASDEVEVESTTELETETETSEPSTSTSTTKAATTKATTESTTEATKSSNSTTTSSTETTTEATEAASSNDSQDSSKSQNSNNSQNVEESGKESGDGSSNGSTQKTDNNTEADTTKATQEATTEAASN